MTDDRRRRTEEFSSRSETFRCKKSVRRRRPTSGTIRPLSSVLRLPNGDAGHAEDHLSSVVRPPSSVSDIVKRKHIRADRNTDDGKRRTDSDLYLVVCSLLSESAQPVVFPA